MIILVGETCQVLRELMDMRVCGVCSYDLNMIAEQQSPGGFGNCLAAAPGCLSKGCPARLTSWNL